MVVPARPRDGALCALHSSCLAAALRLRHGRRKRVSQTQTPPPELLVAGWLNLLSVCGRPTQGVMCDVTAPHERPDASGELQTGSDTAAHAVWQMWQVTKYKYSAIVPKCQFSGILLTFQSIYFSENFLLLLCYIFHINTGTLYFLHLASRLATLKIEHFFV